jgi:hypothetical protein
MGLNAERLLSIGVVRGGSRWFINGAECWYDVVDSSLFVGGNDFKSELLKENDGGKKLKSSLSSFTVRKRLIGSNNDWVNGDRISVLFSIGFIRLLNGVECRSKMNV